MCEKLRFGDPPVLNGRNKSNGFKENSHRAGQSDLKLRGNEEGLVIYSKHDDGWEDGMGERNQSEGGGDQTRQLEHV